jgi:WD40 repeat protein
LQVCVFEPTPLLARDSKHGLDYWWVKTGQLDLDYRVVNLAWNHEGTRLLSAGESLQMWKFVERKTRFTIGGAVEEETDDDDENNDNEEESNSGSARCGNWESIWRVRPPNSVVFLAFSVDGTLFATAGRHDRLVRIWYQNQQLLLANSTFVAEDLPGGGRGRGETYGFIYVAHPRPVTGFSWRDTSRYMPRCAVANMLVTNCEDNISRLWCETVLPDDGLISLQHLDPEATQVGAWDSLIAGEISVYVFGTPGSGSGPVS